MRTRRRRLSKTAIKAAECIRAMGNELAARAWDRAMQAHEIIARDGLTVTDANGNIRPHPCIAIEKESQMRFLKLVKDLRLKAVDFEGQARKQIEESQ